jgi:hypothetical protein
MATAQQIATRALRRLRVVASEETPASADMDAATEALNAMIASWEAHGLSGDVLPLDSRFEQGIIAMLAVRLAEEYGKEPNSVLVRDADDGWRLLQAAFFAVPASQFDYGIKETGQDSPSDSTLIGNDPQPYGVWQSSTAYVERQIVYWNGNIYECTTAGTSGTTGPSGSGTTVTDGTVTWCWRRATGIITVEG